MASEELDEATVLASALDALGTLLGPEVQVATRVESDEDDAADVVVAVTDAQYGLHLSLYMDVRLSLTPTVARREVEPRLRLLRRVSGQYHPIVVAPWLSPQTRAALTEMGCNYLDLSGNVSIDIRSPRLLVQASGAQRDPYASGRRATRGFGGPRAARVVRLLAEVDPPFRATQLADAAGVSLPYATRLLDATADRGLVERAGRTVVGVDWEALLRERAGNTSLLKTNVPAAYVAPQGVPATLRRLASLTPDTIRAAVTGPYATRLVTPGVVGGHLMLYVPGEVHAPDRVAERLGLLRAEDGDVLLLRAGDDGVFDDVRWVDGIPHVALTQLVLDSLSGPGRMPADGEALLRYLRENPAVWRRPLMPPARDEDGGRRWPGSLRA